MAGPPIRLKASLQQETRILAMPSAVSPEEVAAKLSEAFDTRIAIKSYEDPESGDRIDVRDVSELEHALFVYRHLVSSKPTLVLRLFLQESTAFKTTRTSSLQSNTTSSAKNTPPPSPAPPIRTPPPSPTRRNTGPTPVPPLSASAVLGATTSNPNPNGSSTPPIRTPPQSPRTAEARRRSQPPSKKEKEREKELRELKAGEMPTSPPLESSLVWSRGQLIGTGGFGSVYLGLTESGAFIAVKQMELAPDGASTDQTAAVGSFEKEVQLMRRFSHPNIVRYIGIQHVATTISILLEYVPGGSIASLLRRFGAFSERVVQAYARQVLCGLAYLHDNQVVHRDIKGANILVDTNGVCKLADFGCSKALQTLNVTRNKSVQGTPYWMAPEVIRQAGHAFPADIWSLACTVIEMGSAKPPWSDFTELTAVMFHIATSTSLPTFPSSFSAHAYDLLTRCFARVPSERPTAEQLLRHPWLLCVSAMPLPLSASTSPSSSSSSIPTLLNHSIDEHRPELQSMAARTHAQLPGCFALLPAPVLAYVFLALDSTDEAYRLARVCRKWRTVLHDEELYWKAIYTRTYQPHALLAASLLGSRIAPSAWRAKVGALHRAEVGWRTRAFGAGVVLKGHSKRATAVRTAEGLVASCSEDKKVKLWDLAKRKKLRSLKGHSGVVTALAVDGQWHKLYSGSRDRTVRVWDATERKCVRTLTGASDSGDVLCLAPLAPARIAAGSSDKHLRVWDVLSGTLLVSVVAHAGALACMAERESIVVSGAADKSMKIWDLRTLSGEAAGTHVAPVLTVASAHTEALTSVVFPHTDASSFAIYSAGVDGCIKEWDLRYTGHDRPVASFRTHTDAITDMCLSPDAMTLISASRDRTIRFWNRFRFGMTYNAISTINVGEEVSSIAITASMRLLCTTAYDKGVRVYEPSEEAHP